MGVADFLGKAAVGLGAASAASLAVPGAGEVAAPVLGAGALAAKVGQWVMLLAPTILEFMHGSGNDEEAAKKIAQARDGLAARLSESEGMSVSKATSLVNEQLQPLIEQHAQDASSHGSAVASGLMTAAGAYMLGRGRGLGKLAKGAMAAEKAVPAAVAAEEDVVAASRAAKYAAAERNATAGEDVAKAAMRRDKAMESVRGAASNDREFRVAKRMGDPARSAGQDAMLKRAAEENRGLRAVEEGDATRDAGVTYSKDIGNVPSAGQRSIGDEAAWSERMAGEAGGMREVDHMQRARRLAGQRGMNAEDVASQLTDAEMDGLPVREATLLPREPSPSPRAYMTRERFNSPYDDPSPMETGRFSMSDGPLAIGYDKNEQIKREMMREAALRQLRGLLRPGD